MIVESRPLNLLIRLIRAPLRLRRRYHADPLLNYAAIVVYIYVVAAWWDDEDREGESQWFLGKIMSYKTIDSNGMYGTMRLYDVEFDDGDMLNDLEDYWVFS